MKVKISSKLLSLKRRKSTSDMKKAYVAAANRLFKDAIKAFIVASMKATAIDSGMTRASYLPLAAKVRFRNSVAGSTAGNGPKLGHKSNYGFPVPNNVGPFKSRALGERLGSKAYSLEIGSTSNPTFKFKFSLVTIQHVIHEATWQSIQAGEDAFFEFLTKHSEDYFPSIKEWLVNGRIVVNG